MYSNTKILSDTLIEEKHKKIFDGDKMDSSKIIGESLSKNVELYNKYTMILASIFISALTAIGQTNDCFNFWLKFSIFLFSFSLMSTVLELSLLIIRDSIFLKTRNYNLLKKISFEKYTAWTDNLAIISLVGFLVGIIAINIFIFTL